MRAIRVESEYKFTGFEKLPNEESLVAWMWRKDQPDKRVRVGPISKHDVILWGKGTLLCKMQEAVDKATKELNGI